MKKNRRQVIEILKAKSERFNYIVRDLDSEYLLLFSLKPKRYRYDNFWGYVDENADGVVPAFPIKNTDITDINWHNRSATPIKEFLAED